MAENPLEALAALVANTNNLVSQLENLLYAISTDKAADNNNTTSDIPPAPSTSSYHGAFGSPPHSNGRTLPHPSSPSAFTGPLRSPMPPSQSDRMPLGGPLSPPPGNGR